MFCYKCGAQVDEGAKFCHECGTKVVYEETAPQPIHTHEPTVTGNPTVAVAENPVQRASTVPTQANNASGNSGNDLKAFVDSHVRATTSFQSAEELLNSKVPQKFLWRCFGIPAVLFGILLFRDGAFSIQDVLAFVCCTIFFGYPAALLSDLFISSRFKGDITHMNRSINADDLILFLNQNLGYLFPHFREWGYIHYTGFGVRGAIMAHTMNSVTASSDKIGTGFGRKQRCLVMIWIERDKTDPESGQTKYYFGTAMASILPSKYVCMVKTVPILQAVMEYYVKYYKTEGGNAGVLS